MKYSQIKSVSVAVLFLTTLVFIPAVQSEEQQIKIPGFQQTIENDVRLSNLSCEKTVWDQSTNSWVDPFTVTYETSIRFNITLTNMGDNLISDISICDVLPLSMTYADNATIAETIVLNQTIYWNLTVELLPGENISIEFDADLLFDTQFIPMLIVNTAIVSAEECSIGPIKCSDTATLYIQPRKLCEKQVWDENSGSWIENTTADIDDLSLIHI